MDKICVICGAPFKAPPSSKKVTCSPECRSKRAAMAAAGCHRRWSPEAKARRAADREVLEHMASIQRMGTDAAMKIPEGKRGPQNRESKVWELIDPEGNHIVVTNLLDWARSNYTLFEPPCDDADAAAARVSQGFREISAWMRGVRSVKRTVSTYKGWSLAAVPHKKEDKND